jgi:hypothetical protein
LLSYTGSDEFPLSAKSSRTKAIRMRSAALEIIKVAD